MERQASTINDTFIPILDVTPIFHAKDNLGTSPERQAELVKLVKDVTFAMENIGFVQISGHNVSSELCEEIDHIQREYFSLSQNEKNEIKMSPQYPYGYECDETLSISFDENDENKGHKHLLDKSRGYGEKDLKETFQVCLSSKYSSVYEPRIPKRPAKMGKILVDYYNSMCTLSFRLMELFALALELPRDFFHNMIDNHQSSLRLLNYPPIKDIGCSDSLLGDYLKVRASAHSDYGLFTILRQDEIGGLQIRRSKNHERLLVWEDVTPLHNHFVVNIGDLMMRWTNDRWKSTVHRVVAKKQSLRMARQSVAFFFNANSDAKIETLESCCLLGRNKYESVIAGEYLLAKHSSAMNSNNVS